MIEIFEVNDTEELMQRMFIKTQVKNLRKTKSCFTLDEIMHLYTNLHKLALTWGNSYTELPEWIANKKAVINPNTMIKSALNEQLLRRH